MAEGIKIYLTSILNDIRRKYDPTEFAGGAITSILGSADLDLRAALMTPGEASLEITNIMGSVFVSLPDDWRVSLRMVEIAGEVKDHRKNHSLPNGKSNTLHIDGVTIFGDVHLR